MSKVGHNLLFLGLMVATIIGLDISFFKNHTGPRLLVNVGIVLVYLAFYYRFMKRG